MAKTKPVSVPEHLQRRSARRIEVVLAKECRIGSETRKPEFILMEGVAPEGVTAGDVGKAIQRGDVQVRGVLKDDKKTDDDGDRDAGQ